MDGRRGSFRTLEVRGRAPGGTRRGGSWLLGEVDSLLGQ